MATSIDPGAAARGSTTVITSADRSLGLQVASYGLCSVIATATHYAVMYTLLTSIACPAVTASTAGAVTGAIVAYLFNARWTFAQAPTWRSLQRFMTIAAMALALNAGLLQWFLSSGFLTLASAQLITTVLVGATSFLFNRAWSFV